MTVGLSTPRLSLEFVSADAAGAGTVVVTPRTGIHTRVAAPRLAGREAEIVFEGDQESLVQEQAGFHLLRQGERLAGVAVQRIRGDLDDASYRLYSNLFGALGETHHPYRIWHYVPAINGETNGLENYRLFNIGRHQAFADRFGDQAPQRMPAASAVGVQDDQLVIAFVAGTAVPVFLENPEQMPAYRYPDSYGPQPPSFARAAIHEDVRGRHVYISGTASIKGHRTVAPDDLEQQFHVTLDNLRLVAQRIGLADWKTVSRQPDYRVKIYLRHAEHWPELESICGRHLGVDERNSIVLNAEVCRRDLNFEVEASFRF